MLTFVPTPLGNLKDITLRSLEYLAKSQIVLCEDTRVAKSLFSKLASSLDSLFLDSALLLNATKSATSASSLNPKSKQFISLHSHNEQNFISTLSPEFFNAEVIYISDAGMPSICDPGAKLIQYMQSHNLPYNVLVGGCALTVAFCFSGFINQGFIFGGFLPHKSKERVNALKQHASLALPSIWYESTHRIIESLGDIALHLPSVRVFAIKEISKLHQRHFIGTADEILATLTINAKNKKNNNNVAKHSNEKKHIDNKILQGEWVLVLEAVPSQMPSLTLYESDIVALEIPPKIKAKLLSTLTGKDTKKLYENLTKTTN